MSYYPNFGDLLDQYLAASDRPGTWLARRLDVNPATVSRWRNGESRPGSPEVVVRIADMLGVHGEERQQLLVAAGYGYIEQTVVDKEEATGADGMSGRQSSTSQPTVDIGQIIDKESEPEEQMPRQLPPETPSQRAQRPETYPTTIDTSNPTRVGIQRLGNNAIEIVIWLSQHLTVMLGIISALFVVTIVGWGLMSGQFRFSSQADEQHFAFGEWKNLTPGSSRNESAIIDDTERILWTKLNQVPALASATRRGALLSNEEQDALDLWIVGSYRGIDGVELVAELYGRNGEYIGTVSVRDNRNTRNGEDQESTGAARICLLSLQNQLATAILEKLQIPVEPQLIDDMNNVPTHSCEALDKNNDAATLILQGDFATAEILLDQALAIDPDYADAINNLGQLHYYQQEWSAAVARYQQALAIDDRSAIYHYNLALAQERSGNYAAAIESYQAAILIDRFYPEALNNLGFVYLLLEKPENALLPLQRGIAADETLPALHKNLGRAYLALGDAPAAITALQIAIERFAPTPYAEALYYLALAEHENGETENACTTLQDYLPLSTFDDSERAWDAQQALDTWNCD